MIAMNPLKEMIPSNKKRRGWYVLNKKGEGSIVGPMYESALRVVFSKRLNETIVPQRVTKIRDFEMDREVRAIGGRDMIFESERDLHSVAGKGLR